MSYATTTVHIVDPPAPDIRHHGGGSSVFIEVSHADHHAVISFPDSVKAAAWVTLLLEALMRDAKQVAA